MPHLFPGFSGIAVGLGTFALVCVVVCLRTGKFSSFDFDPLGEKGEFEKLLAIYIRAAEFIIGLASGSIVLLVGSSAFRAGGRLPWSFASPLFVLGICIMYGILFMVFETFDYEAYRHDPTRTSSDQMTPHEDSVLPDPCSRGTTLLKFVKTVTGSPGMLSLNLAIEKSTAESAGLRL